MMQAPSENPAPLSQAEFGERTIGTSQAAETGDKPVTEPPYGAYPGRRYLTGEDDTPPAKPESTYVGQTEREVGRTDEPEDSQAGDTPRDEPAPEEDKAPDADEADENDEPTGSPAEERRRDETPGW